MQNIHLHLILILFLSFQCSITSSQNCEDIPNDFYTYSSAIDTIKSSTFFLEESFQSENWINEALFYSCDGKKGFLILSIKETEYVFNNIEISLWKEFKLAEDKGNFYHANINEKNKYQLSLILPAYNETLDDSVIAKMERMADLGDIDMILYLGYYYKCAKGSNIDKAIQWYKKGAKLNNLASMDNLQHIYFGAACNSVQGIEKPDYLEHFYWLKRMAELNDLDAMKGVASVYYHGDNDRNVEQDYFKAFQIYEKCAKLGNSECQFYTGRMLESGKGTLRNRKKAFSWYKESAKDELQVDARIALAYIYFKGEIAPKDRRKSAKLIREVFEIGDKMKVFKHIPKEMATEAWEDLELWRYE